MSKVIGIDLGTTNSVVAYEDPTTGADVVQNRQNERGTPSVVGLQKLRPGDKRRPDVAIGSPDLLIGALAVDGASRDPKNTIYSIKRLMGRFYEDPNVQEAQRRYLYEIVKPDGGADARVRLGGAVLTPIEVSAMILRKLKEDAEYRVGDEVTHAVITVPAYFSMNQKLATRTAGEMAGIRVKTVIDEPTAAAMAFGVDMEPEAQKFVLVYDLGGGTFDISILFITGENFNQMGIEGDMWLGGDDFDHAVMTYVLKQIQREYNADPSSDGRFMAELRKKAEKAKKDLSEMLTTAIVLVGAFALPNGERGDVDVEVTRRDFEDLPISTGTLRVGGVESGLLRQWCEELKINGAYSDGGVEFGPDTVRNRIRKTILLTRKAMKEAEVAREGIDHVLLVGGSTTIPLVQQMLEAEFGADKIMRNIDPMACVALGAGIAAVRVPGIICHNVLGKDADGRDRVCLEPNEATATVCRNPDCGAPLVAQKTCPRCQHANALDAERCANPEGCPHEFRRMDVGNVTAKPIGVLAADDVYEIVVPKSTSLPIEEPIVQTFRTAAASQKAVRVPIYDAEVAEFRPGDVTQWIGAADINLEGQQLPVETRVDVSMSVDASGCLDIEALIQDGSGRRQRVFIDPRIGMVPGEEYEEEGESGDGGERLPEWQVHLMWSVTWAEIALREYEWLFDDHRTTATLQGLVKEAREAIERKDESKGRQLEKQIDETLESEFKGLMILLHAEMRCLNSAIEPGTRSQIRSLIKDISDGIRTGSSPDGVKRKVEELAQLLVDTRDVRLEEDEKDAGTRLKK